MCVGVKLIELEFSRTRPKYVKAFSSLDHWIERSGVHVRYCEKKSSCETRRHDSLNFNYQLCSLSFEVVVGRISVLNEHISTFFSRSFKLYAYIKKKNRKELKKRQGTGNRKYYFVYTRKRIFFQICGRPLTISVLSSTRLLWHLPL